MRSAGSAWSQGAVGRSLSEWEENWKSDGGKVQHSFLCVHCPSINVHSNFFYPQLEVKSQIKLPRLLCPTHRSGIECHRLSVRPSTLSIPPGSSQANNVGMAHWDDNMRAHDLMAAGNRTCLLIERQTKRHQMRDLGSPDKYIIMHNLYGGYLMVLGGTWWQWWNFSFR